MPEPPEPLAAPQTAAPPALPPALPLSLPLTVPPAVPEIARRLANAGLLPFVVGAALVWIVNPQAHPYVSLALAAYAALVISFLGGIHWGLAMRRSAPPEAMLVWGVVPALLAWFAVMMPAHAGLVIDALLLLACYLVDRKVYPAQGQAHWLTLRFRMTGVAMLSCFLGAAGA